MTLSNIAISSEYIARCHNVSDDDLERIGGTLYAAMTRNICSQTGSNCPGCNRPTLPDEPLAPGKPKPRPPFEPLLGITSGNA